MKNLPTFDQFLNEGKSNDIASALVNIASGYTRTSLKSELSKAEKISSESAVLDFYSDLIEILSDEDLDPKEMVKFEKECIALLKKNKISVP